MARLDLKILAISDLCITDGFYQDAFAGFVEQGCTMKILEWKLKDLNDMRSKILRTEKEGPEAVPGPANMAAEAADADVLVTHLCPIPEKVIEKAGRLKVIGCARSAFENVDLRAANRRGVALLYCPLSKISMAADTTMGMILAESRGLARAHCALSKGSWDAGYAFFGHTIGLEGNKVGLIGFGNIGKALAERLSGFHAQLLVHDPYQSEEIIAQYGGARVSLERLLAECDIVVLVARLDKNSRGLIGEKELRLMKKTSYFINTARAGLVDYGALRKVLAEKAIAGAALDVFDAEPLDKQDPLLRLDNVTLTPHVASVSRQGYLKAARDIALEIRSVIEGRKPRFIANPEVLAGLSDPPPLR
jgi:D-3-phosphoglycerate dehydrogenase